GDADAVALGDGALARGDDAVPGPEAIRDHDAAAGGGPELGRAPLRDEAGGVLGHDEHARAALVAHEGVEREDEDVVELLAADLELDDHLGLELAGVVREPDLDGERPVLRVDRPADERDLAAQRRDVVS